MSLLSYNVIGEGLPVVFLHGFLENQAIWAYQLEKLSASYKCVTIDLPGHGKSEYKIDKLNFFKLAEQVFEVLDHLGIEKCTVIGHSMGGYIGLHMAKLNQKRISKLCLMNSHANKDSKQKKIDRDRALKVIEKHYEVFVKEAIPNLFYYKNHEKCEKDIAFLIEEALKMDPKVVKEYTLAMKKRKSRLRFITKSKIPLWYILGNRDTVVPRDEIQDQIVYTKGELRVVSETAHMSYYEDRYQTLNVISEILESKRGL